MSEPEDYTSPLRSAAVQMHELYKELRAAGFNRTEAIELITRTLSAGINEAMNNGDD